MVFFSPFNAHIMDGLFSILKTQSSRKCPCIVTKIGIYFITYYLSNVQVILSLFSVLVAIRPFSSTFDTTYSNTETPCLEHYLDVTVRIFHPVFS